MSRELALATLAFCCFSPELAAAPGYTITSVYQFPQGYQAVSVAGINDVGTVVGELSIAGTAVMQVFIIYNSGQVAFLGINTSAAGINNQGQIVGTTKSLFDEDAFIYGNGMTVEIPRLFLPVNDSQVRQAVGNAINNSGDTVGSTPALPDFAQHAFLYTQGAVLDLGTLNATSSIAYGINDLRQVVGDLIFKTPNGTSYSHAFRYSEGVMSDLGTLGGQGSTARGINNRGQVVGSSDLGGGGGSHAFLDDQGIMMDLGSLGGDSGAIAINNTGQIVGSSNGHAFVFRDGTMWDLNNLIPPSSGWVLTSATAINSSGQIIGVGMFNGVQTAYLATPVQGPPYCQISQILTGPPKQLIVAMQDTGSGLNSIDLTNSTNASVNIPAFSPGTTSQVLVTATKIDQNQSSDVAFRVTNMAGLTTSCDPVDFTLSLNGFTERHIFRNLSLAEHYIRITNGTPGVRQLTIFVDGHSFQALALRDGETYSLDIGSAMPATTPDSTAGPKIAVRPVSRRIPGQAANDVVMYASGQRGSSAYILIGDASVLGGSMEKTAQ